MKLQALSPNSHETASPENKKYKEIGDISLVLPIHLWN